MFTPAVQRIVWKEFRAQRAIWIGIAFELVILQLVRAFSPDRFPINLVSLACVLTGIFAMTSSALLFAGESEAQTDGFLRQLPFRSRDLLLGKLGFNIAAVASFLGFSLLTAKLISDIGVTGRTQVGDYEEVIAYANSILGLWAWGIFYSLVTRKVMWTLLGAGLTEIVINAVLHGVLKGYWYREPTVYAIYRGVVLVALIIDLWLLSRWYVGARVSRVVSHSLAASEVDELTLAPVPTLPWSRSWTIASRAGIAFGVIWYILLFASASENRGIDSLYLPVIALGCLVGAVIGAIVVIGLRTFQLNSSGHSSSVSELRPVSNAFRFSFVLKQAFRLLSLFGACILALALGIVVGFCNVFLLIVGFVEWPPGYELLFVVSVSVTSTLVGGLVLWGVGRLLDSSEKKHTPRLSIRALQFAQSTFQSINRSWGSLLWIEARRALPFLIGGVVVLGTITVLFSLSIRETRWSLGLISLLIASYTCGLMTILPDRSQGTLSFLIERGVPAWRILASKLVVWGLTLGLLAIIPATNCFSLWGMINKEQAVDQLGTTGMSPTSWMVSPATLFLGGLNAGLFAVGALSAAWIRRPVLAVIGGLVGYILWVAWCVVLSENHSLFGMAIFWPLVLWIIGYFASGTTTLLEQVNWKSRARRVTWVMWIVGGSLFWLRDFRTHEIVALMPADTCQSLLTRHAEIARLSPTRIQEVRDQPGWGSVSEAETSILRLNLHLPECDLDASLKSLTTGLEVSYKTAELSQTEQALVEAIKTRRLVLSAIRRWANHPAQTATLLEDASQRFASLARGAHLSAIDLLAYQYAAAVKAIDAGAKPASPFIRSILKLTGEQERVHQLVDLQFSLLPEYIASVSPIAEVYEQRLGTKCETWMQNTSLSVIALGVYVPSLYYARILRDEVKQDRVSSQATALVLKLQLSRLKNGLFPSTLTEVMQPGQIDVSSIGYEPQGFARNLRISSLRALPAHQPVIYFRGDAPFQSLELVDPGVNGRAFFRARGWLLSDMSYQPQMDMIEKSSPLQLSAQTEFLAKAEGPVNPHEMRFVSLGSKRDEDRLCLPPDQRVEVTSDAVLHQNDDQDQAAAQAGGNMQPLGTSTDPAPSLLPSPEIPPVPPQSQPTGDTEE